MLLTVLMCGRVYYNNPPNITNSITTLNTDSSMRYYASESGDNENSTCHYYLKESLERNTSGVYLAPTPP